MTEKKITYALNRIKQCKADKYSLEALLRTYYLNIDLLRFIITKTTPDYSFEGKKVKELVKEFQKEALTNVALKPVITKRSIKSLKPWLLKMDVFFKQIKLAEPLNIHLLQSESEKICGILKISVHKLHVHT
jgi:hypothetical protein